MFDAGMGMLGLGIAGDIFGAYSANQQAQRQRDVYKKQMEMQSLMRDPRAMVAGSQPYVDALNKNLATQIPNIMRSDVNPMIGSRGIDPGSGAGQSIYAQALAPYYAQNAQNGMQNYMNSLQGGMGALNGAGGTVGQPMGGGGNTAQALQMMMMMQALKGSGGNRQAPTGLSSPAGYSRPDMDFNPNTAGMDSVSNPLTYQFPTQSFGQGF